MEFDEALAIAKKELEPNYLTFQLDYSKHLLVPHDAGIKILCAIKQGEIYTKDYGKPEIIGPIPKDVFEIGHMSRETYLKLKIARLLNVDPKELDDKL